MAQDQWSQESFMAGASKVRSAKWGGAPDEGPAPGFIEEGEIVDTPQVLQQTRYAPGKPEHGEPLFFEKSGKPRLQLAIKIQTKHRDDEEDDGLRAIYMKMQMQEAGQEELTRVKRKIFEEGGYLRVKFLNKVKKDGFWQNQWAVHYTPPVEQPVQDQQDFFDGPPPARAASADTSRDNMLDRMKQQAQTGLSKLPGRNAAGEPTLDPTLYEEEPPF